MKRAISVSVCVIVMLVFLGGCSKNNNDEEKKMLLKTKLFYSAELRFLEYYEYFPAREELLSGKYDDVIFVYSEEEAEGYPDNVFVTWPTKNTEKNSYYFQSIYY